MSDAPKRITADEARQAILDALIQAAQGYETQPFTTQLYAYIDQTEAELAVMRGGERILRQALATKDAEVARLREALVDIVNVVDGCAYETDEGWTMTEAGSIARRALEDTR